MKIKRTLQKDASVWPKYVEAGPLMGDVVGIGLKFEGNDAVFALSLPDARILFDAIRAALLECQMDAN